MRKLITWEFMSVLSRFVSELRRNFKLVKAWWKLRKMKQIHYALTIKLYSVSSTDSEVKICKYTTACSCTLKLLGMNIQGRLVIRWFSIHLSQSHQFVRRQACSSVTITVAVWNRLIVRSRSHSVSLHILGLFAVLAGLSWLLGVEVLRFSAEISAWAYSFEASSSCNLVRYVFN